MKSGNDATFWRNPNSRIFAKYEIAVECSHLSNFQNTFNRYIYQMLQKNLKHSSSIRFKILPVENSFSLTLAKKLFFINACKKYDVFIEVKSSVILLGLFWQQSRCFPHNLNLMDLNLNGSGCRALTQFCKNSIWRVNGLMKLRTSIQSLKL